MRLILVAAVGLRARAQQIFRSGISPLACGALAFAFAAATAQAAATVPDQETWGTAIAQAPMPDGGCFTANYPDMHWNAVPCGPPHVPTPPPAGTVRPPAGHGTDYAAVVSPALISGATGSFPAAKGVMTETDSATGVSDAYSIQINSQYISGAPICAGATVPANCQAWEQFVFDSQGNATQSSVFIQYWLLHYGPNCPTGWESFPGSDYCTRNGNSNYLLFYVDVPNLPKIKLVAAAIAGGKDKAVLVTPMQAYGVANSDSVIGLAHYWHAAEFNVVGVGSGSDANFNAGSSLTLKLRVKDGTTNAPFCKRNAGTTAEGNNLTLHRCKAVGGKQTSIHFTESN